MKDEELHYVNKEFIRNGFETGVAQFGNRSYPLCYGKNAISQLKTYFEVTKHHSNIFIVTQPKIKDLFGEKVIDALETVSTSVNWVTISGTEQEKTVETVGKLYQKAADYGIDKSSVVIALGGGVIQDVTNYFAATFHRGIKFIQIPTTVLSQADIGFGGCALNHSAGKSLIGQFYQPSLCLFDETVLYSLPQCEVSSGLSEIINKTVCLGGLQRDTILTDFQKIRDGDYALLMAYIKISNGVKLSVIEKDEDGQEGTRAVLDWGHTVTHALERVLKYQITHGFALGIGMMSAAKLSHKKGHMSKNDVDFLEELIECAGLPTTVPKDVSKGELLSSIRFDQKKLNGETRFILMSEFGKCFMSDIVSEDEVERVL